MVPTLNHIGGVTGPTRREACGSICRLYLEDKVKHRQGRANGKQVYRGKAGEYSGKRTWSTIGKLYPEGKAER